MTKPDVCTRQPRWRLSELFAQAGLAAETEGVPSDVTITSLTDDTRTTSPGACFVAIRGTAADGHQYVDAAVQRGAVAVVVSRHRAVPEGVVRVRVGDTPTTLAKLAAAYYGLREQQGGAQRLVGVTGTNGKTTVAWLLRSILREAGCSTALLGTIEYDLFSKRLPAPLTTPGAVSLCQHLATARDAGADYGVLEVSSHALDQRRCDGLSFSAAVFTNLSGDHLDYHVSMDAYAAAKRHLFDLLCPHGVAVVNQDDAFGRSLSSTLPGRVVSFGLDSQDAEVTARLHSVDRQGSDFVLRSRSFEVAVRLSLPGQHNVANAVAAAATAEVLGIAPDSIRRGLERTSGVPGRLQRAEPDGWPFSVLVDYAHTDVALENVLQALGPLTAGRVICVFGCGGDRDRTKRPRMGAVVGRLADVAYVTTDNPRTEDPQRIIDEILPGFGGSPTCRVSVQIDRRQAIEAAIADARPGDTVLIAGKGHEDYQLVGRDVLDFDDLQVARSFLEAESLAEGVA